MNVAAVLLAFLAAPLLVSAESPPTVRIGTAGDYPPFNYVDEDGALQGFDVDIARALCERLDLRCEWVLYDWQVLIPALLAHEIDAIAASVSITAQRRELLSFSDRYYSNLVRWVAARGSGFDPGDLSGSTVGALRATIAADWLEEHAEGAQVELYSTPGDALDALVRGRIDAFLGDGVGHHAWLQTDNGAGFELVGDGDRLDEGIGIAVRHDDSAWLQPVNDALQVMLADGTYAEINARYFQFSIY